MRAAAGLAAILLAAGGGSAPVRAQQGDGGDAPQTLEGLETRAEKDRQRARDLAGKAEALSEELQSLRERSVELADKSQTLEARLSETEARLQDLRDHRATLRKDLTARREQLVDTLQALERIALQPPAALAVSPESPIGVARAASLLDAAVPEIETRAAALREDLDRLETVRRRIEQERTRVKNTRGDLEDRREELAAVMARKARLVERTRTASREARADAERLAREAAGMRELMDALRSRRDAREAVRAAEVPVPGRKPAPPEPADEAATRTAGRADASGGSADGGAAPDTGTASTGTDGAEARTAALAQPADIRGFPDEKDTLRMPARGEVVAAYGEAVERRGTRQGDQGMMIATRAGARVVAPYDGKVVYAGPFKTYGRILIIQHGDRYHSLLAGLGRIDAIVGQWVLAGEPVGVMGDSSGRPPELYVELRRAGQPIDPAPWLARRGNKVRG